MRVYVTQAAMQLLRNAATPAEVRRAITHLSADAQPPDARVIRGWPDRFELFVSGFWIVYEVKQSNEGTILRILDIEENS